MVKLKAPLMSLKAQGRLSKLFSLARRQGQNIIERRPSPTDAKSSAQLFNRHMFTKCTDLWHLLSEAEKAEWERLATPRHMTGYAWYISQCLRPNPGIYLPLQGGTMSGDIDMDGNKIEDLPDPVQAQEAATKAYADAILAIHAALATVHQNAPALIATHAAKVTGVHGAGDSILATTLNIVNHAAFAAAHHARYANAEAITAAKTVKLDDFATPDDNTDLNASPTRHGLFKKLDNIATHFLNGLGNWVAVVSGPTIATGSYVGNGTDDRQITVGFKCTAVFLIQTNIRFRIAYTGAGGINPATGNALTDIALHASDGFVVDEVQMNYTGWTYYYWAISE